MRIVGVDCLYIVVPFLRHQDAVPLQHGLCFRECQYGIQESVLCVLRSEGEIPAVVHQSQIIALNVLPAPVQTGQFAVSDIAGTDVVAFIIPLESIVRLPGRTDKNRQVQRVIRYRTGFMRSDQDNVLHSAPSFFTTA